MSTPQFSELTLKVTKDLTKDEKKKYGIFMSPNDIILSLYSTILSHLENDTSSIKRILEPSCGTCQILNYCDKIMEDVEIDGVELNDKIYDSIKDLSFKNNVKLYHTDFMKYKPAKQYDLIIGNPPYFVCTLFVRSLIFQKNMKNIYMEDQIYLAHLFFMR
jgi:tRNA1(Val) A37 N6-methylase TrmN6